MSAAAAAFPPAKRQFASAVHAEVHAIIALREAVRAHARCVTRRDFDRWLSDEIARRCGAMNIDPDLIFDEIEQIEDAQVTR